MIFTDPKIIARESFRLIETADPDLADRIIAAGFHNQEADDDPDDTERQQRGPAGFLATSRWLRDAFSQLRFDLEEVLAEDGTVVAVAMMTGRHTGVFNGIAPTGRRIRQQQAHIFATDDGKITHHRAIRDDLGLLLQLGGRPGR